MSEPPVPQTEWTPPDAPSPGTRTEEPEDRSTAADQVSLGRRLSQPRTIL